MVFCFSSPRRLTHTPPGPPRSSLGQARVSSTLQPDLPMNHCHWFTSSVRFTSRELLTGKTIVSSLILLYLQAFQQLAEGRCTVPFQTSATKPVFSTLSTCHESPLLVMRKRLSGMTGDQLTSPPCFCCHRSS